MSPIFLPEKLAFCLLTVSLVFTSACSSQTSTSNSNTGAPAVSNASSKNSAKVIRIAIGTQDPTINMVTGGSIIREEKLLEKHLPRTGKYENVEYKIEWSSHTSGPPVTNKMLANQLDIGMMGDFPSTLNMTTFQQKGNGVKSIYVASLAYGVTGAGNAVMVPKDSPIQTLEDLRGKDVSVPFGSAAHGMLLKALKDVGIDPQKDLRLVSQTPEVGGSSLRTSQIAAHANFVPFGELFPYRGFARKIFDGAQTGIPTFHGVLVRSDFVKENPEIVVGYLKALLEANKMFREKPEELATKVEKWSGIEREVVYMFLGPSGVQQINPTIRQVNFDALKNSVMTLKQLGRLDATVNPDDVPKWADDSYLRQAMKEMGLNYDEVANSSSVITGEDAQTKEPIKDPKLAAQIWIKGENKVMSFASIKNMMAMLQKQKVDKRTIGATFVHDRNTGEKLLADNSFYVRNGEEVSAFLTEKDAQVFASKTGAKVADFKALQQAYSQTAQLGILVSAK
ncbi:ABC transporter substrate-binding protein [Phormidesmis sp. 146-12]